MADEASTFFTRWSRRKALARSGDALPEPLPAPPRVEASLPPAAAPQAWGEAAQPPPPAPPGATAAATHLAEADAAPPLTLQDVAQLTRESDYSGFVARGVAPEVKNAALKKLFSDPHFNVMDGLDTSIDDYGKPDPLPQGMLRQLVQSRMLGLFAEEDAADAAEAARLNALTPTDPEASASPLAAEPPRLGPPEAAAKIAPDAAAALPAATDSTALPADDAPHEDPAVQLQPDDDARRAGPDPGAGQDAGRQH